MKWFVWGVEELAALMRMFDGGSKDRCVCLVAVDWTPFFLCE